LHTFPSLHINLEGLLEVLLTNEMLVALAVTIDAFLDCHALWEVWGLRLHLDKHSEVVIEEFFVLLKEL
jgi:hypothetical protein